MKDNLTKLISSGLKYLVGLIVAALVGWGLLSADDVKALDPDVAAASASASGVIATGLTAVSQAVWRKYFPKGTSDITGPGGTLMLLISTVVALGALPSCNALTEIQKIAEEYPATAILYYRDPETGAKAGLSASPGKATTIFGRVPIYDEQTGKLIGMADVSQPITKPKKPAASAAPRAEVIPAK